MLMKIGKCWVESSLVDAVVATQTCGDGMIAYEIHLDGYKDQPLQLRSTESEVEAFALGVNKEESDAEGDEGCCGECHPRCDELD